MPALTPTTDTIAPTLTLEEAAAAPWDVAVVGAGVAGTLAARSLAQQRRRVLLVDHATFPRDKVCGGCLNQVTLAHLRRAGLGAEVEALGGVATEQMQLAARGRWAYVALPRGLAVSRRALDAALVRAAVAAGVQFLAGASAKLTPTLARAVRDDHVGRQNPFRGVELTQAGRTVVTQAKVILACDGLAGRLLHDEPQSEWSIKPGSLIGVGACWETPATDRGHNDYPPGIIHMAVGRGGYVGLVRVEQGKINVAAALDPEVTQTMGGPVQHGRAILEQAGWHAPAGMDGATWMGTPRLTRQRRCAGGWRVLTLGDAAGYVEPFTGQGMAWATSAAEAVVSYALRACAEPWSDATVTQWSAQLRTLVQARQMWCRWCARGLRHPMWVGWAVGVLRHGPALASPIVRHIHDAGDLNPPPFASPCTSLGTAS